jgi:hypothetical protein
MLGGQINSNLRLAVKGLMGGEGDESQWRCYYRPVDDYRLETKM